VAWEKATGTEANPVFMTYTKNYTREVERNRKRKASEEVKQRRSARRLMMTHFKHDMTMHDMMMVLVYLMSITKSLEIIFKV